MIAALPAFSWHFFGRLHPVLVHLPIGILLIGVLLQWIAKRESFAGIAPAVPITLGIGSLSAVFSCVTGYLLSLEGGYEAGLLNLHQWIAIGTALISIWLFLLERKRDPNRYALGLVVTAGLFVTGHLGGTLTHGEGFLTGAPKDSAAGAFTRKPLADAQQADVYKDVIDPILQIKCVGCHGPSKQKGRLRVDNYELLMKGGKNGPAIVAGNAGSSLLVKRISLPVDDDHHMAPKEKTQLTENEVLLIKWWIGAGAPKNGKVVAIAQTARVKAALKSLEGSGNEGGGEPKPDADIPVEAVSAAPQKAIETLRTAGILVLPVSKTSNWLEVRLLNHPRITPGEWGALKQLAPQLLSLRLSNTQITDADLSTIGELHQLIRLFLDGTKVTDKGLADLNKLAKLKYLNLAGTAVTEAGVRSLNKLPALASIYLFKTGVARTSWASLQASFPHTRLDSGAYQVPFLGSDTVIVKPKPRL